MTVHVLDAHDLIAQFDDRGLEIAEAIVHAERQRTHYATASIEDVERALAALSVVRGFTKS
jgi:hypothetical protein